MLSRQDMIAFFWENVMPSRQWFIAAALLATLLCAGTCLAVLIDPTLIDVPQ